MYCVHMYRIIHPVLRMQSVEILFFQNNVTNSIAMDMFSCLHNGGNWLDLGNFIKSLINLAASVACFSETTNKAETSIRSGTICDGSAKDCLFLDWTIFRRSCIQRLNLPSLSLWRPRLKWHQRMAMLQHEWHGWHSSCWTEVQAVAFVNDIHKIFFVLGFQVFGNSSLFWEGFFQLKMIFFFFVVFFSYFNYH